MKSFKQVKKELNKEVIVYKKLHLKPEEKLRFSLGRLCIEQRFALLLTQAQLAKELGTTQAVISRFESGKANPTLDFLQRMAKYFGFMLTVGFKDSTRRRFPQRPKKTL